LLFTVLDERIDARVVKTQLIFHDHFVIIARAKHPLLASKSSIPLKDLLAYRWVLLQDALPIWRAIEDCGRLQNLNVLSSPIERKSVVLVHAMVLQGDYSGLLPRYAIEARQDAETRTIGLEQIATRRTLPPLVRPMGLVHSKESELTPGGRALLRSMLTVCHELKLIH